MITYTSLRHPHVKRDIERAMRRAVHIPHGARVFNASGEPYLGVIYLRGKLAYAMLGRSSGFWFYERERLNDVTGTVHKALRY